MSKELIVSVTKKDCVFKYYRGSGKGGQKRNKTENCCQCTHNASGAQAYAEDGRSKEHNMKTAFKRMTETTKFQTWLKIEIARQNGKLAEIERKVDKAMKEVRVELRDDKGNWIESDK